RAPRLPLPGLRHRDQGGPLQARGRTAPGHLLRRAAHAPGAGADDRAQRLRGRLRRGRGHQVGRADRRRSHRHDPPRPRPPLRRHGRPPPGTIPHPAAPPFGALLYPLRAFHEVVDAKVRRVALIDTLQDEKFEAIRVAEALGGDLYAVRLDTPSSRRGDFFRIIQEVRWELDIRGYGHVKIIASGGVGEYEILHLNPVVDAYGVGTSIANAPVLNFALDIMEIEGRPMAKRGKWSGAKDVLRCRGCRATVVVPAGAAAPAGGPWDPLLKPLITGGRIARDLPPPRTIRDFVLDQLAGVPMETLQRRGLRRDY